MRQISVGLIGFGTVGSGVIKVLTENREVIDARVGFPVRLKRVADLDIVSDRGIVVGTGLLTTNPSDILTDPEISIVVELIGGYEPARSLIMEAFKQGKHVVTANKALLAEHGEEIFKAAHDSGLDIAFEAAVAGGIPILRSLREGLLANRFQKVLAILNGTCNFILTAMNESPGISFDETLKQAQDYGYAEANPSLDIDGLDSAHKLALMLGLTHGIRVPVERIYVEGIRQISSFDVLMAKEFSYKIKLLSIIIDRGTQVEARIHPTMLPAHHPLARVDGVFNGIYLRGDMVGEQLFYGRGAGMDPTASAVVGDIIEVARNVMRGGVSQVPPLGYPEGGNCPGVVMSMDDVMTNYYLRVQAADQPGVLSRIAGIMADHSISIHSVVQKKRRITGTVPVVFLTHLAREADIQSACTKIGQLGVVEGSPVVVRIEDEALD